jgi:spore photoproduct lyase
VSRKYEHRAPALNKRLAAAKSAAELGWPLRLSFDPVVPVSEWEREYADLIRMTFEEIEPDLVRDITVGPFRLTPTHQERMRRKNLLGDLRYLPELTPEQIKRFFLKNLSGYLPENRIYFWEGVS